jgi:hypothetical protein
MTKRCKARRRLGLRTNKTGPASLISYSICAVPSSLPVATIGESPFRRPVTNALAFVADIRRKPSVCDENGPAVSATVDGHICSRDGRFRQDRGTRGDVGLVYRSIREAVKECVPVIEQNAPTNRADCDPGARSAARGTSSCSSPPKPCSGTSGSSAGLEPGMNWWMWDICGRPQP